MNEVSTYREQLPDTLEDLTQFVLVGRSKLNAYKIKLQTVNRLSDAQSIREQTLQDMQDVSIAIVAAEQRIGEILLSIEGSQGKRSDLTSSGQHEEVKTKERITSDMGYSRNQVSEYQRMAQNPDVVKAVIDEAVKNGEMVTRTQVMKEIRTIKADMKAEMAEKDRRIAELQNREPEVREVVKEVVKEVVPNDYESLKKEVQQAWSEQRRSANELKDAKSELRRLQEKSGEHEIQVRLERDADYFSVAITDFIQRLGGYVWVADRLNELPDEKRKNFIRSLTNLDGWCQAMLRNMEGNING